MSAVLPMEWAVASPYFTTPTDQWISDAVSTENHRFTLIPSIGQDRNWHQAPSRAGLAEWTGRLRQANAALRTGSGVITVFPQLAAAAGLHKYYRGKERPLVAWLFNTEALGSAFARTAGRLALSKVDRFVVHTTREVEGYSKMLGLAPERFEFVPLQYGAPVEAERPPIDEGPYVFATGSGYRDYETFFDAIGRLGFRTYVLASDRVLAGLTPPSNVTILEQISRQEIRRYVRHAAANVVPLTDEGMTAGLITIVETFRHGRSVVVTDHPGLEDYVIPEKNALCCNVFDAAGMADAIDRMWNDEATRASLEASASRFADEHLTDEAAGRGLLRVLDSFR